MKVVWMIERYNHITHRWERVGKVETDVLSETIAIQTAYKNDEIRKQIVGFSVCARFVEMVGHSEFLERTGQKFFGELSDSDRKV